MLERAAVVGLGEVGRRLAAALGRAGVAVDEVRRGSGWERLPGDHPVVVCVGEPDVPEVVARCAGVAPARLVFVANGWLRDDLAPLGAVGRGLIWFTAKGEFFQELRPSPFAGAGAPALVEALAAGGLAAEAVSERELAALEAEKMGFNCLVGLPLAVHRCSLGEYLSAHAGEARDLFAESVELVAAALGVDVDEEWWAAFLAATRSLGWVATKNPKALEYRNGAVVRLARRLGRQAPLNEALLAAHLGR